MQDGKICRRNFARALRAAMAKRKDEETLRENRSSARRSAVKLMEPIALWLSKQDRLRRGADGWSWPVAMTGGLTALEILHDEKRISAQLSRCLAVNHGHSF